MAFFNLFKISGHRVFRYQPRYYDEEKEELQDRINQAKATALTESQTDTDYDEEVNEDVETIKNYKPNIKGQFKRRKSPMIDTHKKSGFSTLRFAIIFVTLCIIAYYLVGSLDF